MIKRGLPLIRFGLVGVLNTAVDFTVFALLIYAGLPYLAAQCAAYSCGVANSYIVNRSWTFKAKSQRTGRELASFVLVNLVTLALVSALLTALHTYTGWPMLVCKLIATLAGVLLNYAGSRYWVFKYTSINRSDSP